MNDGEKVWHPEAIAPEAERTLLELQEQSILRDFYLAGGTGLALQLGHRRSIDLDFFSDKNFDEDALLREVDGLQDVSLVEKDKRTLHASIQGTKVSFLGGYDYPLLFPLCSFQRVSVADARDIACMKITTLMSRGKKRDFIDVCAASRDYGLKQLIRLFEEKYARTRYNPEHVLKSLTYFEDAEWDPMPEILIPISWEEVKQFFRKAVPPLR